MAAVPLSYAAATSNTNGLSDAGTPCPLLGSGFDMSNGDRGMDMDVDPWDPSTIVESESVHEEVDPGEYVATPDDHYVDALDHAVEVEVTAENLPMRVKKKKVSQADFAALKVLGVGGYGKVLLVRKETGADKDKLFAMKCLRKGKIVRSVKDTAHTKAERDVLELADSPFIVKMHYAFQTGFGLFLVLDYCHGGELFSYLNQEQSISEDKALFYMTEITIALEHLHSMDVVYRDLKPENILLTRYGHVKLTDFGLCKQKVDDDATTNTFCGTVDYMAPEIVSRAGHGKSVDWWSMGTLLFDMLNGTPPFSAKNKKATIEKILKGKLMLPGYLTNEARSLIRGLIRRDPTKRLGYGADDARAVKKHPWFRIIVWEDAFNQKLIPPYMPAVKGDTDVSQFDTSFTNMPLSLSYNDDDYDSAEANPFEGFSYVASSCLSSSSGGSSHPSSVRSPRQSFNPFFLGSPAPVQAAAGGAAGQAIATAGSALGTSLSQPPPPRVAMDTGGVAVTAGFQPNGCEVVGGLALHAKAPLTTANAYGAGHGGTAATTGSSHHHPHNNVTAAAMEALSTASAHAASASGYAASAIGHGYTGAAGGGHTASGGTHGHAGGFASSSAAGNNFAAIRHQSSHVLENGASLPASQPISIGGGGPLGSGPARPRHPRAR